MPVEDIRHPEKSSHCLQKEIGKYRKDKKRDKEGGTEVHPGKGVLKKREVSKHQETLSLASLASLEASEGNITGRKNK